MGNESSRRQSADVKAAATDRTGDGELPPFTLPGKTKKQLIRDPAIFKDLDDFVRNNIPKSATSSVKKLASHLGSKCHTDLERIRAIYCWLAYHITYDTESYLSANPQPQDVSSVLKLGKAMCQGYCQIFQALCQEMQILCVLVPGIAKDYAHDPECVYTVDSTPNHGWNLVLVDGEWRPLDSTWGAGYLDKDGNFIKQFDEHWFLTDPEEFVPRHFPLENGDVAESRQHQLMPKPITVEEFSASVDPSSYAYTIGLQLCTHRHTVIDVKRDVTIKMKASPFPLKSVDATMTERGSNGAAKDRSSTLLSLSDDGTCAIYVRPRRTATYLLEVFGLVQGEATNTLHTLLSYVIKCKGTHSITEPFPDKSGVWGPRSPIAAECGLQLVKDMPFTFNAKEGQVKVPVPLTRSCFTMLSSTLKHARKMDEELKQYTFIEYTEDGATISARLPKCGYYKLDVFAEHPVESCPPLVAEFLLYADNDHPDCQPFPRADRLAYQERAKLLQPLDSKVPSGRPTLFRMRAANLGQVRMAGKMMDKKADGVWELNVTPEEGQNYVTMHAAVEEGATSLRGLYRFAVYND